MRILVIEDDELVASGLKQGLSQAGFTVDLADSAEAAADSLRDGAFDLAVVDIGLPQADGLTLIRHLRAQGNTLPVLVLTARGSLEEMVCGLDVGADDYLAKPFQLAELCARLRALLRRSHARGDNCLRHNGLTLDISRQQAILNGELLELTRREWVLLEALLLASPNVLSKERLVQILTGWDKEITSNAVEVYVSRLRSKLAAGGINIRTVRGIGYRIDAAIR
ncbi:MAG TPA: response regulator [Accumulibacter sp.]|nr:response regulator [Accumulibacter sp.]HMW18867.1 response regulator [Accumulibacter sp.]HMX22651.1 response regulator [Accumulibacter sp.]HMY05699.1 response regulator [Accumulibacter sp.]HNC16920.1 response regulator [Accumulibacter sp.]